MGSLVVFGQWMEPVTYRTLSFDEAMTYPHGNTTVQRDSGGSVTCTKDKFVFPPELTLGGDGETIDWHATASLAKEISQRREEVGCHWR